MAASALLAIMALIVIFAGIVFIAAELGYLPSKQQVAPGGQAPATDVWKQGGFNIGFNTYEKNALSGASVSTSSASYQVFHSYGKRLKDITSLYGVAGVALSTSSTTSFAVDPKDNGIVFISINPGTGHYPHVKSIRENNPGFLDAKWIDVDTQNKPRLVIELDLKRYGTPNLNVDPSLKIDLFIRVVPEDTAISLSSPSDITGIGTTAGTEKTIEWTITGITADSGIAISELYISSNQTSTDYEVISVSLSKNLPIKLNDPWGNEISSLPIIYTGKTSSGVTQTWYLIDAKNLVANAYLVPDPSGGHDGITITVTVKTYFTSSGHGATCVLNVKLIDADGTEQSVVSDSVTLQA